MRRWVRWGLRALLAVAVCCGLTAGRMALARRATRSEGEQRLAQVEATLDQTDPGWRLSEVLSARDAALPVDDRNLTKLCWDIYEKRPKSFETWAAGRGDWLPTPQMNRLPVAEKLAAARAAHAEAAEAVGLARTVRARPTGGWKLTVPANPLNTRLEHVQRVRTAAVLLEADSLLAAEDRDWSRAVAAVEGGLHLRHAVGDEPLFISQLVRTANGAIAVQSLERLIGWGEPPAVGLTALQTELLAEADVPRLVHAIRGERGMAWQVFANVDARLVDLGELTDQPKGQTKAALALWQYRPDLPADQADYLEYMTGLLAAVRLPADQRADAVVALDLPPREFKHLLSGLLRPSMEKWVGHEDRACARLRSAAVGVACERFRQANGRWPADLGELEALLPAVPLDPYDGQSLRYRKLDDGVVVYSVGPDRQDDGGTLSYGQPEPGEDVGFRLWDVAARRQPALAED